MENVFKILKNIKKLVTNTPLVEIKYEYNNKIFKIYAKCEWYSITGSIKDKVAYQMLYDAYKSKNLKMHDNIVEVSSGNMGIALCSMANLLKNKVTIIMPKNMSIERKQLLKMLGANLVEVEDFKQAFTLCNQYQNKGYFCPRQFENSSNYRAHYFLTAKEISKKISKNVKCFVAGVGTSGTLTGIGTYFKKHNNFKIVAIEPQNAQILSNKKPFLQHKLQGLSDEILPKLYHKKLVDQIIQIGDNDAIAMSQKLAKQISMPVGISSGANFLGAVLCNQNAVTVFPDDNKKYLSTDLTKNITTKLVEKIKLISMRAL